MHKLSYASPLTRLLVTCGITAISVLGAAQTSYVLTDLGASVSGQTLAMDISPSGIVVGISGAFGAQIPCTWTPSGSGMTFRSLGKPTGAVYSWGFGVNDSGQIAGTGGKVFTWENGFLWSGSSWADLSSKQSAQSEALAVSASGSVVGCTASAAIWEGGKVHALPGTTVAYGMNDLGQVVGYYNDHAGYMAPFIWTPSAPNGTTGTTTYISGIPGGRAMGINLAGDVVGDTSAGGIGVAFYLANGSSNAVPLTFGGNSSARKINNNGQAVGNAVVKVNGLNATHGFVWDSVNGMQDLNGLNIVGGIPAGWVFVCGGVGTLNATNIPTVSINDAGRICGTAQVTIGGVKTNHAFLLTPQSAAGP